MEDFELEETEFETPICKMKTGKLNKDKITFVPNLRSGMGILDGIINFIQNAKICHIGIYRDDLNGNKPLSYFFKVPKKFRRKRSDNSRSNANYWW